MTLVVGLVAACCAGLFAGAAIYVSLVEHPARVSCGPRLAVTEFGPSYHRGAVMQASLAVAGSLAAIAAWLGGGDASWLLGALIFGSVVPFTLIVIRPTNARLLEPALDKESPAAAMLLRRWGRLHAVRSGAGAVAFVLFVLLLARGPR